MKKYEKPSLEMISMSSAEFISAFASFGSFESYDSSYVTSYADMSGRNFIEE